MSSPLRPDPEVVALLGDLHGNLGFALEQLGRAYDAGAQVVVQLGEFGYWRGDPLTCKYLLRLERKLAELDVHLLWLDGNHEDHHQLDAKKIDPETGLRRISPHGFRWIWSGYISMALGGAVSVDKRKRREGGDWWPQEVLSAEDVARAVNAGPVDVLLTHDAPAGAVVPGLVGTTQWWSYSNRSYSNRSNRDDPAAFPKDVLAEADARRELLRTVIDAVRPRRLWHGHMHVRYTDRIDLGWRADRPDWTGEVRVHGLGHDQGHWADNLALVGPDGLVLVSV